MAFKADSIFVSGLDPSIGEDELTNEIFVGCGTILSVILNYDRSGKSSGTATIRFQSPAQAQKAQKELDGAQVDGKKMSVQLIGTPTQPKVIVKAAPTPAAKKVTGVKKTATPVKKAAATKRAPVKKAAPVVQASPRRRAAPRSSMQAASRPVIVPRETRRGIAKPVATRSRAPVAAKKATPVKKAPVGKKPAAAAAKKGPAAKKPVGKKAAPAAKKLTAAQLDAQMDKYNARREAKSE